MNTKDLSKILTLKICPFAEETIGKQMIPYVIIENFADNGEHSHWSVVEEITGKVLVADILEAYMSHDSVGNLKEIIMPKSQAQAINEPNHKTWADYRKGCLMTFRGGHHEAEALSIFQHGMETVFNLLEAEFPQPKEIFANQALDSDTKSSGTKSNRLAE